MPSLYEMTEAGYAPREPMPLPVEPLYQSVPVDPDGIRRVYISTNEVANPVAEIRPEPRPEPLLEDEKLVAARNVLKKIFGLQGTERYQLWPEKVVREGLAGAGEVMKTDTISNLGLRREDLTDIPAPSGPTADSTWLGKILGIAPVAAQPGDDLIEKAQAISALAGSGGLAGGAEGAALNATPSLRPALKYKEKLYKGKEGQQHMDVIPNELYPEFQKMAMSGEDISHYNFGFVNDKGQFLTREKALQYAVDTGLIDKDAGKYGALTSTLMADSSKPGTAIEAIAQTAKPLTIRGVGADIGHESLVSLTKPDHYYRGISEAEYNATIGAGKPLKSNESSSFKGEGTNFSHDARDAESYANFGRSDPRKTGTPNYLIEIKGSDGLKQARDGYFKAAGEIDPSRVTSVIKMEPKDNAIIGTILKADSSKEGAALQANKPTFYSAVEHNLNTIPQSKMTGDQWLGTLSNKPGVKGEELDWTGLKGFLEENKGKPVTKAQIEEHLAANKVELKEVSKGELKELPEGHKIVKTEGGKNFSGQTMPDTYHVQLPDGTTNKAAWRSPEAAIENMLGSFPKTKYHSYQLPGGENYKELLLTLPRKEITTNDVAQKLFKRDMKNLDESERQAVSNEMRNLHEAKAGGTDYRSSHWDEPNILAHVRMNDRTIDGKKSLHLEEIQSDWHQQGRDKGYRPEQEKQMANLVKQRDELQKEGAALSPSDARYKEIYAELPKLQTKINEIGSGGVGVPDAPFKKSWHELALKRMIREAAEKGYDRLSWAPGEAQAARYDLSKSVDKIAVPMVNSNGTRSVRIDAKGDTPFKLMIDKDGKVDGMGSANQFSGKPLSDVVGKEMADKIMKLDKPHEFSGEGLKIGGEGMKGFYDQIIPKALEKLGKEHGVKVKKHEPKKVEASPEEISKLAKTLYETYDRKGGEASWENLHPNKQKHYLQTAKEKSYLVDNPEAPVFYIDIPTSLKNTALSKGFPLFSNGYMLVPVSGNPFAPNGNEK